MSNLGTFIRQTREALQEKDKSYSLRQVASRMGVEPSYLSKVERGLENPSEEFVRTISKELNVNEDTTLALGGKVSSEVQEIILKNPKAFTELLKALRDSPPDAILKVVRQVRDGNW